MSGESSGSASVVWRWTVRVALILTALWTVGVLFAALAFENKIFDLSLSEAGDFWAGVAAPPAFLWLILGFYQQGRELQLQVRELRESVEQFRAQTRIFELQLSNDTKQALRSEIDAGFDDIKTQMIVALKPVFRKQMLGSRQSQNIHWGIGNYDTWSDRDLADICSTVIKELRGLEAHGEFITLTKGWQNHWGETIEQIQSLARQIGALEQKCESISYEAGLLRLKNARLQEAIDILRLNFQLDGI